MTGKGAADWPARTLFVHSQRIDHPEKWRKSAVMTDRWRLINGKELYDMTVDPGQKKDVAKQHPETKPLSPSLRKAYERWWADISKRFDEYCEIIVGSDKENPTLLTLCCHDWHGELAPSLQDYVRSREVVGPNGFWALEVARPGKYQITLREQPALAKFPIRAQTARLTVGKIDESQPDARQRDAQVTFFVRSRSRQHKVANLAQRKERNQSRRLLRGREVPGVRPEPKWRGGGQFMLSRNAPTAAMMRFRACWTVR